MGLTRKSNSTLDPCVMPAIKIFVTRVATKPSGRQLACSGFNSSEPWQLGEPLPLRRRVGSATLSKPLN
jgi:hypothetical protein